MNPGLKAIRRKDWENSRSLFFACCAILVGSILILVNYRYPIPESNDWPYLLFRFAQIAPLGFIPYAALHINAKILHDEFRSDNLSYLRGLPVGRDSVWWVKTKTILLITLILLAFWLLSLLMMAVSSDMADTSNFVIGTEFTRPFSLYDAWHDYFNYGFPWGYLIIKHLPLVLIATIAIFYSQGWMSLFWNIKTGGTGNTLGTTHKGRLSACNIYLTIHVALLFWALPLSSTKDGVPSMIAVSLFLSAILGHNYLSYQLFVHDGAGFKREAVSLFRIASVHVFGLAILMVMGYGYETSRCLQMRSFAHDLVTPWFEDRYRTNLPSVFLMSDNACLWCDEDEIAKLFKGLGDEEYRQWFVANVDKLTAEGRIYQSFLLEKLVGTRLKAPELEGFLTLSMPDESSGRWQPIEHYSYARWVVRLLPDDRWKLAAKGWLSSEIPLQRQRAAEIIRYDLPLSNDQIANAASHVLESLKAACSLPYRTWRIRNYLNSHEYTLALLTLTTLNGPIAPPRWDIEMETCDEHVANATRFWTERLAQWYTEPGVEIEALNELSQAVNILVPDLKSKSLPPGLGRYVHRSTFPEEVTSALYNLAINRGWSKPLECRLYYAMDASGIMEYLNSGRYSPRGESIDALDKMADMKRRYQDCEREIYPY